MDNVPAPNSCSDIVVVVLFYLEKEKISDLKAHELFEKGVLRTFQIAHEFSTLTVLENLMMVPGNQYGENLLYSWFKNSIVSPTPESVCKS